MFNFRRFLSNNLPHPLKLTQTTKATRHPRDSTQDLNTVKLIGTISSDVISTEVNKARLFFLRTYRPDTSYDSHKIIVSPYMIENLPELPQNGQNLLITGKIGTQHFSSLTGKKQTSTHIFAKQIYFCDESYGRYHVKNANRVELQAHICFDITNEETHSVFVLALHFQSKDPGGIGVDQTNFVPVFAYDDSLRNIIRNQLKRLDRVRVEGMLRHKPCIAINGKKQYQGYIEATQIAKIISLQQIEQLKLNNEFEV